MMIPGLIRRPLGRLRRRLGDASRKRRVRYLRSLIDPNGFGLEIGPLCSPLAPKREGFRVEILDHTDTAGLREKYRTDPNVDVSLIEEVDHVWDGRPLTEVIGARARYDWIVASHVIEHTPDPIGWMLECAELLRPGGRLVLAVPDSRRCFDALRPTSSVGQLLQAHMERRTRHAPAAVFDHIAYMARLGGKEVWVAGSRGQVQRIGDLRGAWGSAQASVRSNQYVDVHGWVWTPSTFRQAIDWLSEIQVLPLSVAACRPTRRHEFFVALEKPA